MAVDTRNKRASCVAFSLGHGRVWPNPDNDIANAADREHVAFSYPGVAAAAPSDSSQGIPFPPVYGPVQAVVGLLIR